MKTILPFTAFLFLLLSCGKEHEPQNAIVGTWKVTSVRKQKLFGSTPITGEVNYTSFTFHADHTVELYISDPATVATGTWDVETETTSTTGADGEQIPSAQIRLYTSWNGGTPTYLGNNQITKIKNGKLQIMDDNTDPNVVIRCEK